MEFLLENIDHTIEILNILFLLIEHDKISIKYISLYSDFPRNMNYYIYNIDEYQPLEQGNKFAPTCPFRMVVSGSSDSGKTTMVMNLLMGDKNMEEDGERYILCNDVILIGKHLDEPKWNIVRDFYNLLIEEGEDVSFKALPATEIPDIEEFGADRSTVVIFEDLMNASKKIQKRIAEYFSSERHRNISSIY